MSRGWRGSACIKVHTHPNVTDHRKNGQEGSTRAGCPSYQGNINLQRTHTTLMCLHAFLSSFHALMHVFTHMSPRTRSHTWAHARVHTHEPMHAFTHDPTHTPWCSWSLKKTGGWGLTRAGGQSPWGRSTILGGATAVASDLATHEKHASWSTGSEEASSKVEKQTAEFSITLELHFL
jgi:hypothetical protein